jgi:hypothetical protein
VLGTISSSLSGRRTRSPPDLDVEVYQVVRVSRSWHTVVARGPDDLAFSGSHSRSSRTQWRFKIDDPVGGVRPSSDRFSPAPPLRAAQLKHLFLGPTRTVPDIGSVKSDRGAQVCVRAVPQLQDWAGHSAGVGSQFLPDAEHVTPTVKITKIRDAHPAENESCCNPHLGDRSNCPLHSKVHGESIFRGHFNGGARIDSRPPLTLLATFPMLRRVCTRRKTGRKE